MYKLVTFTFITLLFLACKNNAANDDSTGAITTASTIAAPANISYNIIATYPHDTSSYTQGLIWQNNALYESTGLEGQSRIMKVDLKNGKPQQSVSIDPSVFGEGITILNDKIYELTWQSNLVYVYDSKTFKKIREFSWDHEGWGITHNGKELIISTGDSNLYFVDPETFKLLRIVGVTDNNGPVGNLNELEYIKGAVFSNIYLTDYIVKIDPATGHITGRMDLSGLLEKFGKQVNKDDGNVLNGIAFDSAKNSLYVTGKKWPLLYEMKLN
ncbi:glutaminyl-peptide cyclotransferase [Segetibacter sp.]|jgi:glutamine cyclotransferase|uniref:glutaminyl-peptide cyclotransferase n=1 Tax=Segetibacter sp. TaxID=2231182 RepID=UPI0026290049|nr:glutaminyl-peptide cyclotransferase [Segetibacter sp.]MCW3079789.1 glutaminyl-peptide cyclotransferase [Segetibacter sp.]